MYSALICWGLETDGSSVCIHRRNDGIRTRIGRVLSYYWLLFCVLAAAFTFLLASVFDLVIVMGVACGLFFVLFCCVGCGLMKWSLFCPRYFFHLYAAEEGDFRVGGGKSGWVRVCVYNESDDILRAERVPLVW
jgi:hypothetical protein